jgi:hypothetical protein
MTFAPARAIRCLAQDQPRLAAFASAFPPVRDLQPGRALVVFFPCVHREDLRGHLLIEADMAVAFGLALRVAAAAID